MTKRIENLEVRFCSGFELRREKDAPPVLSGYAAKFDAWSTDLGGFREILRKGAFADSLKDTTRDVFAFLNHDYDRLLGKRSAKTLEVTEDDVGLSFSIRLADTTAARDVLADIEAGNISGMSFGMIVQEQKWTFRDGDAAGEAPDEREILRARLIEVSPVFNPAYLDTTVSARSHDKARQDFLDTQKPTTTPLVILQRKQALRNRNLKNT